MSDKNRVSAALSSEDLTTILAAASTAEAKLSFLVSLDSGESRELPKLGPKTVGFDEQCEIYMKKHPELVPSFVDLDEVAKDRALRGQLAEAARTFGLLAKRIEDTLAVVSHEIYNADLAFYQNVKQASTRGVPDAQSVYQALSARFPGRSSAKVASSPSSKPAAAVAS